MKISHHQRKLERLAGTLQKLNYDDDYETMIEDFLLAAAHAINAALHKKRILAEDKDIKHNRLFGFLKNERPFGDENEEITANIQQLEQLRPSHVYGKGENGATAKKAEECFSQIHSFCRKILENERES